MSAIQHPATQHRDAYARWRDAKLSVPPRDPDLLRVHIGDPARLSSAERTALLEGVCRYNFVLFRLGRPAPDPESMLGRLGAQLGLRRLDHNLCAEDSGISALSARPGAEGQRYIPYTNRPLSWHTDGYYNSPARQIRAWLLYCAQDAASGGENEVLDHEIAYIRLRDHDATLVDALMAPDALTIPANEIGESEIRGAQSGPVFSWMPDNGRLHMRYSARQRNVVWKDEKAIRSAAAFLRGLFSASDDHIFRYRLRPGEGLLSNNVLHRREGFVDDPSRGLRRLVYRARFYDRIAGT